MSGVFCLGARPRYFSEVNRFRVTLSEVKSTSGRSSLECHRNQSIVKTWEKAIPEGCHYFVFHLPLIRTVQRRICTPFTHPPRTFFTQSLMFSVESAKEDTNGNSKRRINENSSVTITTTIYYYYFTITSFYHLRSRQLARDEQYHSLEAGARLLPIVLAWFLA